MSVLKIDYTSEAEYTLLSTIVVVTQVFYVCENNWSLVVLEWFFIAQ